MKNKICYILLGLLTCFSFVNVVFAEEISLKMTASVDKNEVVVGEESTITVNLKSDVVVSSCQFSLQAGNTLEFVDKHGMLTWNFAADDGEKITINNNSSDNLAYTDGKNIFNLVYKVNGNGKLTIKDIQCKYISTGDDESTVEEVKTVENIEVDLSVKQVSQDTSLSSLSVTGGKLLTEFSPDLYQYQIELDSSTFGLEMTTKNPDYQDDIVITDYAGKKINPEKITYSNDGGQNLMQMVVTINGNTSQQYVLIVHYEQKNLDNSLASLKIDGKSVELKPGEFDYKVKLGSDVTEINVVAVLKDSENFKFREGNEPGLFKISSSLTSIALIIEPKSSDIGASSATYIIELEREQKPGSNGSSNIGGNNGNTTSNPSTGGISMFVMAFVLIFSLIASIVLYQKNIESYK